MANICNCFMMISGDPKSREDLLNLIHKQDEPSLEKIFTWFLKRSYYGLEDVPETSEDGIISLSFSSKWSPPEEGLSNLSEAYPLLTFRVNYQESGNSVYGVMTYSGGARIEDTTFDEETYLRTFDEDFKTIVSNLEIAAQTNYPKFLKKSLHDIDLLEDYEYIYEKVYLRLFKKEDLPLFINHEWLSSCNKEDFLERLKGK